MARELKPRRGTTAQHAAFTGALNEVTLDTTKKTLVIHDGVTAGGAPLPTFADLTGGLPVQATDLVVEVTSDAEYVAAVDNYWNYQFTVAARYVIQFQTGYVITMQLNLDSRHMPNLEFRTQTTTTVDCTSFIANALGIKTPFLFVNSEIAAFYGTYVGTNGATTSPLCVIGSTLDFWNGNMLTPQTLNMSGFLATGGIGGFFCIGWTNRVPCFGATLVTLDVHLNLQNSSLTGDKFKVGGGVTSLAGGSGHVHIELTSGATGRVSFSMGEYSAQITHQASAYYTYIVGIAASVNLFMSGVTAMRPDPTYNKVFSVGSGSRLGVSLINPTCVWHPETSGDYFVETHGEFNVAGGSFNIDTTLATPDAILRAAYNSSVSFGLDMDSVAGMFPSGICHDALSNFIEENTTTNDGALVNTRRGNPSFLSVVPTEAAVVTPDYYPANLSIDTGVPLTATTIDLVNYAKDGLTTTISFDANTIAGVTWAGGTFVGAPAAIAGGEVKNVTYRASNSTFYFS